MREGGVDDKNVNSTTEATARASQICMLKEWAPAAANEISVDAATAAVLPLVDGVFSDLAVQGRRCLNKCRLEWMKKKEERKLRRLIKVEDSVARSLKSVTAKKKTGKWGGRNTIKIKKNIRQQDHFYA